MAGAAGSHEIDDAFAVDGDVRDEFVIAGFGTGTVGDAVLTCSIA